MLHNELSSYQLETTNIHYLTVSTSLEPGRRFNRSPGSGSLSRDVGQGCGHLKARLGLEDPPSKSLIHGLLVEASVPLCDLPFTPLDHQVELFSYFPEQAIQERARKKPCCLFTAYSQKWRSVTLPYPGSHTGLAHCMCVTGVLHKGMNISREGALRASREAACHKHYL